MKTVLIHGLGQSSSSWDNVKLNLGNDNDIIAIDLFSNIESPVNYEKVFLKIEKMLNSYSEKVNICGLSLGGVLALDYTSKYPDKVNSLVLIATPYIVPKELKIKQNEMFGQMPEETFTGLGLQKQDFINLVNTTYDVDIPSKVNDVICKTLIVCGENDFINLESSKIIYNSIENSELSIIKNAAHTVNIDNPIELSKILNEFLKQE